MWIALILLIAPLACAQKIVSARAGMIYYAEGAVTVDGRTVRGNSGSRPQVEDGQTFASPRSHAEILMGPGATLWTGPQTEILFDNTSAEQPRIVMFSGSAIIEVRKLLDKSSIRVQTGDRSFTVATEGVYRFGANPPSVRAYAGEIALAADARLRRGLELVNGTVGSFDTKDRDGLLYFAAYRSFWLEGEAGPYRAWRARGFSSRAHSGFGIEFPTASGAARMKYLAGAESGLVNYLEGEAFTGNRAGTGVRLPFRLGSSNFLRTSTGRAEVFLGVGIVARLDHDSQMRVLDLSTAHPQIGLDEGSATIEVAGSPEAPRLRVNVGDSITEIAKPGVYRFDVEHGTLMVYGGESATVFPSGQTQGKAGQSVNLRTAGVRGRLEAGEDEFLKWTARRSLSLYTSAAGFMTGWEETMSPGEIRHKVFGKGVDPRPRPRPRRRVRL